jgi:MHS family proline/betaine transporter-like MFS transporter
VPLFGLIGSADYTTLVLVQIAFGALLAMNDGTLACFLAELFPTRVRYSGFAFSFNLANTLFGGTAPFMCTWLIKQTGNSMAPAWYLVLAATVAMVALLFARERAGVAFDQAGGKAFDAA